LILCSDGNDVEIGSDRTHENRFNKQLNKVRVRVNNEAVAIFIFININFGLGKN